MQAFVDMPVILKPSQLMQRQKRICFEVKLCLKHELVLAMFEIQITIFDIIFFQFSNSQVVMRTINLLNVIEVVVIQFLSGAVPLAEMAGFIPFLLQLLALRLSTLLDSASVKSIFSVSSSTCFQLLFGRPRLFLPLTLRSIATLKTILSPLLSTCPYHLTSFAVANRSIISYNPNMSICSSVVFLSTTF